MNSAEQNRQTADKLNYIGIIIVSVLAIAFVGWFIKILADRQNISADLLKTRYIDLIDRWISAETRSLSATQREAISKCVYDENPALIFSRYSAQYVTPNTHAQDTDDIEQDQFSSAKDFLDDLEFFIDHDDMKSVTSRTNSLSSQEVNLIKDNLKVCMTKNGV